MCKIASYPTGAEALLDQKILTALSTMDVFNYHPTVAICDTGNTSHMDFIPDVGSRYLKLFTPLLTLCNTIITSVGCENEDAVVQVCIVK